MVKALIPTHCTVSKNIVEKFQVRKPLISTLLQFAKPHTIINADMKYTRLRSTITF